MKRQLPIIDGIAWQIDTDIYGRHYAIPICPKHRIKLNPDKTYPTIMYCPDCEESYKIPRRFPAEREYAIEKYKAIQRKDWDLVDIDGTLTPVTKKEKIGSDEYFCTAQVRDSKRGPQVVIYAGKKGSGKSQIFVTPEERRLSFDQSDINPADVFTRITAEFCDGTKHTITRKDVKGDNK